MRITGDTFEWITGLPDRSFDMVLADPPYNLGEDEKVFLHRHFLRLSRGAVVIFSPPENQWMLPAAQYLFWVKPISTKNTSRRYSRFVEMIFVYYSDPDFLRPGRNAEYWYPGRHWSQYTNVFTDLVDDSSLHKFRKAPSLIERLILNHTKAGEYILDPFAGSGVVEEVAKRLGRDCYSIEIEEIK